MRKTDRFSSDIVRCGLAMTCAVILLLLVVACEVETDLEVEAEMEEAKGELEEAGAELSESLEAAGEEAALEAREAGERLEPMVEDAQLTGRVKMRLTGHPDVNPLYIDVDSVDGRVTLTGRVRSEGEKQEAIEVAENTEGVVEVVDNLQVGPRND